MRLLRQTLVHTRDTALGRMAYSHEDNCVICSSELARFIKLPTPKPKRLTISIYDRQDKSKSRLAVSKLCGWVYVRVDGGEPIVLYWKATRILCDITHNKVNTVYIGFEYDT